MRFLTTLLASLVLTLGLASGLAGASYAQTSPNLFTGQVPTAAQWNSYFTAKQDFQGSAFAANNAALQAFSTAIVSRVARMGFATAGDGGYAQYTASASACTVNFGVGDNGSQVRSADNKCWLIDPVATPLNPFQFGAKGNGTNDDTAPIMSEITAAITLKVALGLGPAPTAWRTTSALVIDYSSVAGQGWEIHGDGAKFDTTAISSGPSLTIQCGQTSTQDSADCQGLYLRGKLQLNGNTADDFVFLLGKSNLSDVNQGVIIDDLLVTNASTDPRAGGCQFNFPTTDQIWAICNTAGGGAVNRHGVAAGATIVGASMTRFALSATAATCVLNGNCTTLSKSSLAHAILISDPIAQAGIVVPPPSVMNTFSGGDLEVTPSCFGVTASTVIGNSLDSQFMSCFQSINQTLPTIVTLGGTITAGNVVTLTANGSTAVSYTVLNTDTLATVATALAAAVSASSPMQTANLFAVSSSNQVYLEASTALQAQATWVPTLSGGASITATSAVTSQVSSNTVNNISIEGQPSWTRGNVVGGFEVLGQGFWSKFYAPYGTSYAVQGLDNKGTISSYRASAPAVQTIGKLASTGTLGASSITLESASGVVSGLSMSGLGIPAGVTSGSPSGNVVPLVGGTLTQTIFAKTPVAFTPTSDGSGGSTLTTTLPDCTTINGTKDWEASFIADNGNVHQINTVNTQKIALDGVTKTSAVINLNADMLKLRCNGSYWMIEAATAAVLADSGFGAKRTWTPVMLFGGQSTTATVQGQWTQDASKQVVAELQIALTNANSHTGAVTITGLPVVANNVGQVVCPYNTGMSGLTAPIMGYVQAQTISLFQQGATAVAALNDSNFTTTSNQLNCTATYIAQ